MGLIQLHSPECEPVSLKEARSYLRIEHENEDELIEHLIKTARQAVESYTVRALMRQAWRFTFNSSFGGMLSDNAYLSGLKGYSEQGIELPRSPFIEMIEKPKLMDAYGAHEIKSYRLDNSGRVAYLHFSTSVMNSLSGSGVIQVDFWTGYGKTPDEIPEAFRHAILMMVAHLYAHQSSANDNALFTLPLNESVIQLIKPYRIFRLN